MSTTTYNADRMAALKAERSTVLANCKNLLARVKAAGRDLDQAEVAACESGHSRIAAIDTELAAQGKPMVAAVMSLTSSDDFDHEGRPRSIFSDEAKAGIMHAVKSRTAFRTDLHMKAAMTTGGLLPTIGTNVEGGLHPNSQFPLASLFPSQPADGPSVRYYRTTAGTAAVVAESALKPSAGVVFTAVDLLLTKLACIAQFSDEMQEDAPFLLKYLAQELTSAVLAAENALIVSTFVATSGVLTDTAAAAAVVDLVAAGLGAQEAVSGVTPSAIIANPVTIATIRQSKASTSGVYNLDPLSSSPSMLHGVRLVARQPWPQRTCGWPVLPG
jgi:HK97 family phage major capsid protein